MKQIACVIIVNNVSYNINYSIMDDLHNDLKDMQTRIVQWLSVYDKINVQCIEQKYNAKLQGLLEGIVEFDCNKIKQSQIQFTNQVTNKHIQNIEAKIKEIEKQKKSQQKPTSSHPKSQIQQPIKQASDTTTSLNNKKKEGSFFASIFGKMSSKDKKSYQIILPDKQPNCYYDHNTRSYIFEGEQPEAPKIIPKPPSIKQIHKTEQSKETKQISELNAMIAPLAFKRKSTNMSNSKSKGKQQIQIAKIQDQPLTYSLLVQKINAEYDSMLHKIGLGIYTKLNQNKEQWDSNEQIKQMVDFADRTLSYSHEINMAQSRLIQKCEQILTRQNIELKLLQKVIRQCHQSHIIYDQFNSMVNQQKEMSNNIIDNQIKYRVLHLEQQLLRMQSERQNIEIIMEEQSKGYKQKEEIYKVKQNQLKQFEDKMRDLQNIIQNLVVSKNLNETNLSQVENDNTSLRDMVTSLHQEIDIIKRRLVALNQLMQDKQRDYLLLLQANQSLKHQIVSLQSINKYTQNELESSKQILNELHLQVIKQKSEIINLLNLCEQKQSEYLKFIRMNFNQANQNQLQYLKKQQLYQTKDQTKSFEDKSLINILKTSTQRHLQKIQILYQNIVQLHRNYTQAHTIQSKLKENYSQQNSIMLQSQARLKSLVQSYKTAKEETDQKCSKLQLQCDKLRKKLRHYKQEEQFNRSYIFKLKTSNLGLNNDSMISLQSDNEQLAQKLDSMQKQINLKNQNLTKLQTDLQDLLTDYQKDQFRQLQLQKKIKQYDRNLKLQKQDKQQHINKIKLLELKLKNQKQKNQQLVNNYQIKLVNIEATHEKKSKILKQQLEQTVISHLHLKDQLNELTLSFQHRLQQKEDYHSSKEEQLNLLLSNKQIEIQKLYSFVNQSKETQAQLHHQIQFFKQHRQTQCMRFEQLSLNMNKLIDQHLKQISILQDNEANMNGIIAAILQKYKSYQQEQEEFKQTYEQKIIKLQEQLLQSKIQAEKLLQQLSGYCKLVNNFDQQIVRLQESQQVCKDKYETQIINYEQQVRRLQQSIEILQQGMQIKKQDNLNMKTQMQQLQQTLLLIQTQIDIKIQQNSSIKTQMNQYIVNLKKQYEDNTSILTLQIHQLTEQLMEKQHEINHKNQQIISMAAEIQKNIQLLHQTTQLNCSYQQQTQQLSSHLQQKQNSIKKLEQNLSINNSAYKEIVEHNISLQNQLNNLKAVLQAKDSSIIKLENDLIIATNILEQKIHQLARIQQNHLHALNEGVASLKNNIEMKQELIDSLTQELSSQKGKSTDYFNNMLKKQEQNKRLTIQMQTKEKEVVKLNQQIQTKVQMFKKLIEKQQNDVCQLKNQIQSNDIVMESYKQSNQTLSTKINQILNQLNTKDSIIQQLNSQIQKGKTNELKLCEKVLEQRINVLQRQQQEQQTDIFENNQSLQQLQILQAIIMEKQNALNAEKLRIEQLQLQNQSKSQSIQFLQNKIQQINSHNNNINMTQKIESTPQDQQIQNLSKIGKLRKALAQKQRQLRQKAHKATDLQEKLDHTSKIVENQRQELQFLKNRQQISHEYIMSEDNQMRNTHETSQIKFHHSQLQQLTLQFSLKQQSYKNKIQKLQRELLNLISLKNINKTLQDNYKSLELENASLNSQKVQLLRSNSYLMEINQKLVGTKSPHTIRDHPKSTINIPSKGIEKQPKQQSKSEIISQQKHDQKSFFGSLSSFFLTPTERDRLTKG